MPFNLAKAKAAGATDAQIFEALVEKTGGAFKPERLPKGTTIEQVADAYNDWEARKAPIQEAGPDRLAMAAQGAASAIPGFQTLDAMRNPNAGGADVASSVAGDIANTAGLIATMGGKAVVPAVVRGGSAMLGGAAGAAALGSVGDKLGQGVRWAQEKSWGSRPEMASLPSKVAGIEGLGTALNYASGVPKIMNDTLIEALPAAAASLLGLKLGKTSVNVGKPAPANYASASAALKRLGIKPTAAMIEGPASKAAAYEKAASLNPATKEMFAEALAARENAVKSGVSNIAAEGLNDPALANELATRQFSQSRLVGDLTEQARAVRSKAGEAVGASIEGAQTALPIARKLGRSIPSAINQALEANNIPKDPKKLVALKGGEKLAVANKLYELRELSKGVSDYAGARELLKDFDSAIQGAWKRGEIASTSSKALKDARQAFATALEDTLAASGPEGKAALAELRNANAEFKRLAEPTERIISLEGKVSPDRMAEALFGGKQSLDLLQSAKESLPKEQMQGIKAAAWQKIARESMDQQGNISPDRMQTALSRFTPEQKALLLEGVEGDIKSLMTAMKSLQGARTPTGTTAAGGSQTAALAALLSQAGRIPGAGVISSAVEAVRAPFERQKLGRYLSTEPTYKEPFLAARMGIPISISTGQGARKADEAQTLRAAMERRLMQAQRR